MRRILLTVVAFALLSAGSARAHPRESVVALISPNGQPYCSGFVINQARRFVMTANHCLLGAWLPTVGGGPAVEVFHVPQLDVAILYAPHLENKPALKPGLTFTWPDQQVRKAKAYGFANGWPIITELEMVVTLDMFVVPGEGACARTQMQPNVVPGMSGGPIVNEGGLVVGMSQQAHVQAKLSYNCFFPIVYEATKDYWEVPSGE